MNIIISLVITYLSWWMTRLVWFIAWSHLTSDLGEGGWYCMFYSRRGEGGIPRDGLRMIEIYKLYPA